MASAAPEPAEDGAGTALFSSRCGRSARGPRFAPGPEARKRGKHDPRVTDREGGHIALFADTYTVLRALAVMAVTLRPGPSPQLCETKAVATVPKALDVRADVLHRYRGSSAAKDGHKHSFSTSLFQNA